MNRLDFFALEKQKRKERLEKLKLTLIKFAYGLFLTYSLLGHTDTFKTPLKLSTFVAIAILIVNFIIQYNRNLNDDLVAYLVLMSVALIHSYYSGNFGFFKLMLFAGSMRTMGFKDIIRFDMKIRACLIFIVSLLCEVGIIPDVTYAYDGITRRSMGFTNPNTLGIAVFVLVCDILYAYDFKLNIKIAAIISAITMWLYVVARSRTAALAIIVLLFVTILKKNIPQFFKSKFFEVVCYVMPIVLTIATFIVTHLYMSGFDVAKQINKLLSGRVKSIVNFVEILDPVFWGQPIHETLDYTLDNTFAFVFYDLGIVVFILFFIFYFRTIRSNFKHNNINLAIIMLAFMCYGLSEHLWINVDYNIFMLAFAFNPKNEFELVTKQASEEKTENLRYLKYIKASSLKNKYFKDKKTQNEYLKKYIKGK